MSTGKVVKADIKLCPSCHQEMGQVMSEHDNWFCGDCFIQVKSGQVVKSTTDGELVTAKPTVSNVVRLKKEEPKTEKIKISLDKPKEATIDFWFTAGVKRTFHNIVEIDHLERWMKLTKSDGKEVLVNSDHVSVVEYV